MLFIAVASTQMLFYFSFLFSFFSKTLVSTRLKRARENLQPRMNFNISKLVYVDVSSVLSVASRIRGMVAQVPFDEFHRYSTSVIKKAVFGVDKDGKIKQRLRFDANQLVR